MSKNPKNDDFSANSANLNAQNIESQILFLAINEREKSLKFYESLLDSNEILDENLRKIFSAIAQKENEILANARAILAEFLEGESSESIVNTADLGESNAIILPSALPQNIWEELQNEMGAVDLKSLNILALGVESHHLKTCDFLIKKAQDLSDSKAQDSQDLKAQNLRTIDILYQLQALSYNHHIALLQGESPKENKNQNANPNPANPKIANPNPTNPPQITLQDVLNQSPLFTEIKTAFDSFQNFYMETKNIVLRLEKGDLSQEELVAFLQKLRF